MAPRDLAAIALLAAIIPSCSAGKKLHPCPAPTIRLWCRCEVAQTTGERAAAGLPVACTIPFAATACVDSDPMGGFSQFLTTALDKLRDVYSSPNGMPYVVVGDRAFYLRCPTRTADGKNSDCVSDQPGNPWPTLPVADLDSASPMAPGTKPQGGPGGSGTGTGTGTEGGDCALCLATAPCDGLTQDQCVTMHCAAICPWDDAPAATCSLPVGVGSGGGTPDCVGPGAECGVGATCCAGLYCYGTDVGAVCM